jgi:hypothetical protein
LASLFQFLQKRISWGVGLKKEVIFLLDKNFGPWEKIKKKNLTIKSYFWKEDLIFGFPTKKWAYFFSQAS